MRRLCLCALLFGVAAASNCSTPGRNSSVTVDGRNLLVDGQAIFLKGVAWNPYGWGTTPEWGQPPQYSHFVHQDAALMQSAGINAVRTYRPITDVTVLDVLWSRGIYVIMTIFYDTIYGDSAAAAAAIACEIRSHPAVLMWLVMNEPNIYYGGGDINTAMSDAEGAIQAIKEVDETRPVAVCWGELPPTWALSGIPSADVWSSNAYRGTSFHGLFGQWSAQSEKPWFVSEYGVDSYSSSLQAEDQTTHATEVTLLLNEISGAAAASGGTVLGGFYFEWSDEWWKFTGQRHGVQVSPTLGPYGHDTDSLWPTGGYADPWMHEEWFGLVDINRNPKLIFTQLHVASGLPAVPAAPPVPPSPPLPPAPPLPPSLPPPACYADSSADLALSGVGSASTGSAVAAFDGNPGTRWASDSVDPSWLEISWSAPVQACTVEISWENAQAAHYNIEGSNDGATWDHILYYDNSAATFGHVVTHTMPAGTPTYSRLRMYGIDRTTGWGYSIWTMAVYGAAPSPPASPPQPPVPPLPPAPPPPPTAPPPFCYADTSTDLALSGTGSASTGNAADAFDGNPGTRWNSASVDPSWLEISWPAPLQPCAVRISWEFARASLYSLQGSNDGTSWVTLLEYDNSESTSGEELLHYMPSTRRGTRTV